MLSIFKRKPKPVIETEETAETDAPAETIEADFVEPADDSNLSGASNSKTSRRRRTAARFLMR
jgi:hypothetical protein